MLLNKLIHAFAFMPARPIYIKPDGITLKPSVNVAKNIEESFTVSPLRLNHAIPSQQWRHPSRYIQTVAVLTGGQDTKTLPLLRPSPAKPRMHRKSCFILENHRLFGTQRLQFFLKPSQISLRLWTLPEYKNNRLVLNNTLIYASTAGPGALLALSQSVVLSEPPPLARPTGHGLGQTLAGWHPNASEAYREHPYSNRLVVLALDGGSSSLGPLGLLRESSGSGSCVLGLRHRLSILGTALQALTTTRQSLSLLMRQGFVWLKQKVSLFGLLDALKLVWDFSCFHIGIQNPLCHFI